MNETQKKVYDYISKLCDACILTCPNGDKFVDMGVSLSRQDIAKALCLSEKTIDRALTYLLDNKYIYRLEYNKGYIYSMKSSILNQQYLFCMVKTY